MSCKNCPVKCASQCVAEKYNTPNLCEYVDPDNVRYKKAYETIIQDKSCGTNNYVKPGNTVEAQSSSAQPKPSGEMPSLWQQAKSLTKAVVDHTKTGFKNVSESEQQRRMEICRGCELFIADTQKCGKCHCYMPVKTMWSSSKCPLDPPKWDQVTS